MELKRLVYATLNRPVGRPVLSALASSILTVKNRQLTSVRSRGANWIHSHPTGILVERELHLATIDELDAMTRDFWFHRYTPQSGDIVVDVGAGTGWEALLCSRLVGPSGKVIAIEAHPGTYACLAEMVERNNLRNVIPVNCAIVDVPGTIRMSDSDDHQANSVLAEQSGGVEVPAKRLDNLCDEIGIARVDLLKMNIEGAERVAVKGLDGIVHAIRHLVISCHDFRADWGHGEEYRSRADVQRELDRLDLQMLVRADDDRPWVRDYVYASHRDRR